MEEKNYLFSAPTLILLSIGIIALLGFAFMAIEGGRIYMERYQAQSAANETASAICGVSHNLTNHESGYASLERFNRGGVNTIAVNRPPTSGEFVGNLDYVEVIVNREISGGLTYFASSDQVNITGRAVVLCDDYSSTISSAELEQE